ncbi:MAG: adenosine kinase [Lentisphaeria bacterium]|nr:adenosine kinase [Lentisphaeria bacterium]
MKKVSPRKILGIGSPIIDISCQVTNGLLDELKIIEGSAERCSFAEQDLLLNTLVARGGKLNKFSGGSAGNAMKVLAKLIEKFGKHTGGEAYFAGVAGDDDDGKFFRSEYAASGVNLKYFSNLSAFRSDRCVAMVSSNGERSFRTSIDASLQMNLTWLERIDFSEFDIVLVEAYQLYNYEFFVRLLERISESGAKIAIDLGSAEVVKSFKNDLLKFLADGKIEIVFANNAEGTALLGGNSAQENCRLLAPKCRVAAIKDGANGSWVACGEEFLHSAACPVNVVDTTGAGDSWAGAFLFGLIEGKSLSDCADFANSIGALMVQTLGTDLDLGTISSVKI